MKILIVAADAREFRGIQAHVRSGRLGDHEVLLSANGAGATRAASAVDESLKFFPAEAIVSTGFCGALSPELEIADVVVGTAVTAGSRTFPALQLTSTRPHHIGVVCSIDRVAQTAAEKRRLSGSVVEMEAGGVAERAAAHGLPFYCVRVVTDLAGEDMANDFNRALRPDGHFATIRVLLGAMRSPLVCVPELLRLRSRCARAARVLGDFIADCRF